MVTAMCYTVTLGQAGTVPTTVIVLFHLTLPGKLPSIFSLFLLRKIRLENFVPTFTRQMPLSNAGFKVSDSVSPIAKSHRKLSQYHAPRDILCC